MAIEYRSATIVEGGRSLAEAEGNRLGRGSAAELLGNWRAAERDRVAAEETAGVASLAAAAASDEETAEAARLSLEASQRAEHAARRTSEAAKLASKTARRESDAAEAALEDSRAAEDVARARFQDGASREFRKESG